jgi:hypothetical protein
MVMALVNSVSPVTPTPSNKKDCQHSWWKQYASRHIRVCGECGEERPMFDLQIKHQR